MKLYYNPMSPNSQKVLVVLAHLQQKFDGVVLDFTKGEHKAPEYLAKNPNGMVPTLVDGEVTLWESNAIVTYLAEKYDPAWLGNAEAKANLLRWLLWQNAHFDPPCAGLTFEQVLKQAFGMGGPDAARVAEHETKFRQFAAILDQALVGRSFLFGDSVSVADYALTASLMYAEPASIPVADFAALSAWRKRVLDTPAWRSTQDG
jgi:glutathione S-transferase